MTVQWVPTFASVDMVRVPGALAVAISNSTNSASGGGNSNVPASFSLSEPHCWCLVEAPLALILYFCCSSLSEQGAARPRLLQEGEVLQLYTGTAQIVPLP